MLVNSDLRLLEEERQGTLGGLQSAQSLVCCGWSDKPETQTTRGSLDMVDTPSGNTSE